MMRFSRQTVALGTAGLTVLSLLATTLAMPARAAAAGTPQLIDDSQLQARFTTVSDTAGAEVVPTTRTVSHWYGQTRDPHNGVTYGYNIVGANPNTCSGAACSTTVEVDITPLIVNVGGMTFDGTDVVDATLASPQFALNDYGSTPAASLPAAWPNAPAFVRGPGGTLSQGDAGNLLQLEDATMRAQFNQTGSSPYHVKLHPNVLPPVIIAVPANQGTILVNRRGILVADVDWGWWEAEIQNLNSKADATHLPLYLTDDVLLYFFNQPGDCCVVGFHGTKGTGRAYGNTNSNGNAVEQTFAWASYVRPGLFARPNGGTFWGDQDIDAVSHEISEWTNDPFITNFVEPFSLPYVPWAGCNSVLETGDPVTESHFAMGANSYFQGLNPNGTQSADGYFHPEDEVMVPWFMRTAPNTVSEPTQSPSANVGRYTFLGDLNPIPDFHAPAPSC